MPISIEKKLIFVRIPNESEARITDLLDLEDKQAHGISYYIDNYLKAFTGTSKVCVIRNPWDRFALFFELVKEDEEALDHKLLKDKTFAEFVEDFKANRGEYKNACWLPQTAWIWSEYGPIMNHIFVEDPEYLETPQFTDLAEQIKKFLNIEIDVPEIDREAALDRRERLYTKELVDTVSTFYKHDVQAFSYVYEHLSEEEEPLVVSTKPPVE